MAYTKRFKKAAGKSKSKPASGKRYYKRAEAPDRPDRDVEIPFVGQQEPEARQDPALYYGGNRGRSQYTRGGRGDRGGGNGKSNIDYVTGLFESKKGGSFSIVATDEIVEKLAGIKEGDRIGISDKGFVKTRNGGCNMFSLWIALAEE